MNQPWPPDYSKEFAKRAERLARLQKNPEHIAGAFEYYRTRPVEFIEDWCCTYDPRNAEKNLPTVMPFILFQRQKELVEFVYSCIKDSESGLLEKARDMGATWTFSAFSVWLWLFKPGAAIGWGSRKEMYVDAIGNKNSIFEKIRDTIRLLPRQFWPKGFEPKTHMPFMRIINPENGSSITGEAGDNIGRGGRSLIYFKDEAAWYEHPELIEAALGDNTDVQIDLSSVHGTANPFYQRRQAGEIWEPGKVMPKGKTRVFIMDWRDHPAKSVEWYNQRREKAESEGRLAEFKQEVDRDYTGAIENLLIPAEWVKAAIDAHQKLGIPIVGRNYGGLDVADEGGDKNAAAIRKGDALLFADHWGEGDTTDTALKGLKIFSEWEVSHICYDSVGVGAGVKAAFNKLPGAKRFTIKPWNGGEAVLNPTLRLIKNDPNSPTNKDFFANLKAQAWWSLRTRFHNTFKAVQTGVYDPKTEIIIIPSGINKINEIKLELSQPTYLLNSRGQVIVDKKPDGAKSPNLADAIVMAFFPKETPFFA